MDGRLIHRAGRGSGRGGRTAAPLDLHPQSVYEVVTRQMLEALAADVQRVRERVDAIFFLVVASIVIDLLLRLAGRG
jgi:hypothetical protein